MLAPHLPGLLRPARQAAARLALAAVLVFAVAWVFGAWALGSDPGQGKWRGRAFNDFPDAPPFNGELVRASIDGSPLQVAPAPLPLDVEHAFARDSFTLRVAVRPGPPIAWRENVITIIDFRDDASDANNSLVMMLNRVRHRALLSFRINAARARLRTPSFNLGPAFDVPSGREVTLEVSRARGMLRAAAVRNGQPLTTEYRIGPELLWAVMAPRTPRPGLEWIVEAFLWPAALLLVAGYWTGRSGSRRVLLLAALLAILVQVATPPLFAVAGQSPLGWTMLLGALVLGALAGRRSLPADDSRVRTHDL